MAQEIVVGHRYGILRGEWGLTKTDDQGEMDPYGIEIDYYDRVTKVQGRVKLMVHQIPSDLLTPVNEALNAIVQHGLQTALAEVEKTHYAYGHEVGEPYPEIALEAETDVPGDGRDTYTMHIRLCDDVGMVSDTPVQPGSPGTAFDAHLTYRKLHDNLRARNANPDTRLPYEGPDYACTGHAHLAGEHIECTGPAHGPTSSNSDLPPMELKLV